MKNLMKKSALVTAILMTVMLFAGITCFAKDIQPAVADDEYAVTTELQTQDSLATEEQAVQSFDKKSSEKDLGKSILIGVGVSFVITLIVCICIKSSYKNHGHTEPYKYDENAKLTLIDSSDVLVNTHVEKRKINNN